METSKAVSAERRRRLTDLAMSYRVFGAHRWGELGDGHITVRDPERADHMWLIRDRVPFDRATVGDMVLVEPDGSVAEGDGKINSSAYYIHQPIHDARPDVVAAAHTHTQWGTPFATERRLFEPISQEACLFYEDHALFDDEEVSIGSVDGGKRIAVALGGSRAVILANHGLLTVGGSVAACVGAFVTMERVAEVHMKARDAVALSHDSACAAKDHMLSGAVFEHIFDFLTARHVPECSSIVS